MKRGGRARQVTPAPEPAELLRVSGAGTLAFMEKMQAQQVERRRAAEYASLMNERNAYFAVACALIRKAGGRVELSDHDLDMHPLQKLHRGEVPGGHSFLVTEERAPEPYPDVLIP